MLTAKQIIEMIFTINETVRSPLALECIRLHESGSSCDGHLAEVRRLLSETNWHLHEMRKSLEGTE